MRAYAVPALKALSPSVISVNGILTSSSWYFWKNILYSLSITFCSWFCWALILKMGCGGADTFTHTHTHTHTSGKHDEKTDAVENEFLRSCSAAAPGIQPGWSRMKRPAAGWPLPPRTWPGTWRAAGTRRCRWAAPRSFLPSRTSPPSSSSALVAADTSAAPGDSKEKKELWVFLFLFVFYSAVERFRIHRNSSTFSDSLQHLRMKMWA